MAVEIKSNRITGITSTINSNDAASKYYTDSNNQIPLTTEQENEFLRTDGSAVSWEPIGAYQEYTTPGTYTFTVPSQAKELLIEATGAGGGGASGNADDSSYINSGQNFSVRLAGSVTSLNSVIYGSNLYVASGDSGGLRTSINGINWTLRTASTIRSINAVAYNSSKSTYIAGGYGAPEWTRNDVSGPPYPSLNSVVYSAGQSSTFVSAGNSGILATSSTGTSSWTLRTSGFGTTNINALTYYLVGGTTPTYVIGGPVTKNTWVLRTSGFGTTATAAVFGNSTYVVVGNSGGTSARIFTSTNSIFWTLRSSGSVALTGGLRHLSFASDKPSAAYLTGNLDVALTSTNAIFWTSKGTGFGSTAQAASTYFNGEYLIGGASTPTVTWISSGPGTTGNFLGSTYGNGLFVVGGASGRIFTSPNGITWTLRTNASTAQNGFTDSDRSIVYASDQGIYVAGSGTQIVTSTNAIFWTLRSTGQNAGTVTTVAYGLVNGTTPTYVAGLNTTNGLLTSSNAIFWTIRTGAVAQTSYACLYANNTFVLGGSAGRVTTSTNGIFWTSKFNSINSSFISGIAYDNDIQLYAVCDSYTFSQGGAIYTSTDSNAWILRTQAGVADLYGMNSGNGLFVAHSITGRIITSTNGIIWIIRTGVNATAYTSSFGNDTWITAGATGAIQYSTTDRLKNLGWGALLRVSTDTNTWTTRTTSVGSQAITTMGSGGSYAFISGTNLVGAPFLNVSTNNIFWTSKDAGLGINAFAYDGTNYIVAGNSGYLAVSTDTTSWTLRTSGFGANSINAFSYDNGVYVASGATGITRTSTDGIIWIARTSSGITGTIISTLYDSVNDIYVNVAADSFVNTSSKNILGSLGSGALLSTSTDAISWTIRTTGLNTETVTALGTGAGDSLFVAGITNYINQNTIFVSSDGILWTARTAGFGTSNINSILYAGGNYLAAGNGNRLLLSTDSIIWQSTSTGLADSTALNSLTFGTAPTNTYVVAAGGGIATSTDGGTTWILRTSGTANGINALTYNDGVYVAGGDGGVSFTSTNAIYWFARTSGFGTTAISGLAYGNDLYIFVGGGAGINATSYSTQTILSNYGQGAYVSSSSDGINWVLRTAALNTQNITALTTSSNFYVAGYLDSIVNSNIVVSTDALVWEFRTSGFGRSAINSLYFDGTNYIATGDGGTLAVSTDTTNWTFRTSGFGVSAIDALIYGNGIYAAAGDNGTLTTSPDTITWTLRTAGATQNINALLYNNGVYVLAGNLGLFRYSTDSINWSGRVIGFGSSNIRAITWGTPSGSGIFSGLVAVAGTPGTAASGAIASSINPGGFAGSGGGGGAVVSWNISKAYITGSSLTVNVGQGGSAGQAGAASTVSWTGNSGTYTLTANGGSGGNNVYDTINIKPSGGTGGVIPSSTSNYLTASYGPDGGSGSVSFGGISYSPTVGSSGILAYQTSGGGGGAYSGLTAQAAGSINYYGNNNPISANTSATSIAGLSYGNGGGGGSAGLAGGSGVKGGGGGGGGYNSTTDSAGAGGVGGDGYVRISWQ